MGWQLGWCHPHGGIDGQGGGSALVPAGLGLSGAASVEGVGEETGVEGKGEKGEYPFERDDGLGGHMENVPILIT